MKKTDKIMVIALDVITIGNLIFALIYGAFMKDYPRGTFYMAEAIFDINVLHFFLRGVIDNDG